MADDVQDIYIATEAGDAGWQSLSALAAEQVEAELPISSADKSVTLSDNLGSFHVETGGKKQFTVTADGTVAQGYNGQANIGVALYTQYATSPDCNKVEWGLCSFPVFDGQPTSNCTVFESQPVLSSDVRAYVTHFKATDGRGGNEDIGTVQAGFICDGLTKSTVANYGFVSNVNKEDGKDNYQFICNGDAPSSFRGEVLCNDGAKTTSVSGLADNDAEITFDAEVEVRTDGRFIVAPQTRGPTLTDAVITVGSWNLNKGARLEFGWPNASSSDYVARAEIRKNSVNSDLVYAHYNLTGSESVQNGHVFYSNILGQVGIGNKLMELREGGTAIHTGGVERVKVTDAATIFSNQVQTDKITSKDGASTNASIELGAELLTSNHIPTQPNSLATKKTVDDKIWVGTQEAYDLIDVKNIDTLYCIVN